jgi:hypothetical protein
VNATTCLIKADQPMYYAACPEEGNNKKVTEENGKWFCEATQKTYDTCRRRCVFVTALTLRVPAERPITPRLFTQATSRPTDTFFWKQSGTSCA